MGLEVDPDLAAIVFEISAQNNALMDAIKTDIQNSTGIYVRIEISALSAIFSTLAASDMLMRRLFEQNSEFIDAVNAQLAKIQQDKQV